MSPIDATAFMDAVETRRSIYALTDDCPISDTRLTELIDTTMANGPSAFNTQPIRILALFGPQHKRFWQLAREVSKATLPEDAFKRYENRIKGFEGAYGSIVFFADTVAVEQSKQIIPACAPYMEEWTQHSMGMHQYVLWTALEAEGCGANLQHYNMLGQPFTEQVREAWSLPAEWQMTGQLVFGGKAEGWEGTLQKKTLKDLGETVKIPSAQ